MKTRDRGTDGKDNSRGDKIDRREGKKLTRIGNKLRGREKRGKLMRDRMENEGSKNEWGGW